MHLKSRNSCFTDINIIEMADVKKLVFSVIRFLQDQRTSNTLEEEQSESLEGMTLQGI